MNIFCTFEDSIHCDLNNYEWDGTVVSATWDSSSVIDSESDLTLLATHATEAEKGGASAMTVALAVAGSLSAVALGIYVLCHKN